jgi:hypothetical protein
MYSETFYGICLRVFRQAVTRGHPAESVAGVLSTIVMDVLLDDLMHYLLQPRSEIVPLEAVLTSTLTVHVMYAFWHDATGLLINVPNHTAAHAHQGWACRGVVC